MYRALAAALSAGKVIVEACEVCVVFATLVVPPPQPVTTTASVTMIRGRRRASRPHPGRRLPLVPNPLANLTPSCPSEVDHLETGRRRAGA